MLLSAANAPLRSSSDYLCCKGPPKWPCDAVGKEVFNYRRAYRGQAYREPSVRKFHWIGRGDAQGSPCDPELPSDWLDRCSSKPLPWYIESKLHQGAYSSLLGLTLRAEGNGKEGSWDSLAVGDSCVCQVRGDSVLAKFPIQCSHDFNNRPILLGSRPDSEQFADFQSISARWEAGDSFYLMTDAAAAWFLKCLESDDSSWRVVRDFSTESADFEPWVCNLRSQHVLRNDDMTLIRVDTAY